MLCEPTLIWNHAALSRAVLSRAVLSPRGVTAASSAVHSWIPPDRPPRVPILS
jgi:capsid protein